MAEDANGRIRKFPARRGGAGEGFFFPNEVIRILGLKGIDYRQLRRLFRLVVDPDRGVPAQKWSRYSFRDLVALREAIAGAGGLAALRPGRRLQLKPLEAARDKLREHYGITDPMVRVRLRREGRVVIASLDGTSFETATGQIVMTLGEVNGYLDRLPKRRRKVEKREELDEQISLERNALENAGTANLCALCGQVPPRARARKR